MEQEMRRKDRAMTTDETWALLERGKVGCLGTVDAEGWPYVVPFSYAVVNGAVYIHHTKAKSQMRANVEANPRVCFEVDEPGFVFPSGEQSGCQTSLSFESVILFGYCTKVEEQAEKEAFFGAILAKYADPSWVRPNVWSDSDITLVYRISVDRITGKRRPPMIAAKWRDQFPK